MGCAIGYSLMISPIGAKSLVTGLNLFLPEDDRQPADAVVVLGRGDLLEKERSQRALDPASAMTQGAGRIPLPPIQLSSPPTFSVV